MCGTRWSSWTRARLSCLAERAAGLGEGQGEEGQGGHLADERLGRGDADLGPGVEVEDAVRAAGHRGVRVVGDGQDGPGLLPGGAEGGQGVGRFARLGDAEDERPAVHDEVARAELGGVFDLDGDVGQRLEEVLPDEAGVVGRAAGDEDDARGLPEGLRGEAGVVEEDPPGLEGDPALQGVPDDVGLLEDLLGHEVLEAALLDHGRLPVEGLHGLLDRGPGEGGEADAPRRQDGDLAVVHVGDAPGVVEEGRDVRREEGLAGAEADDGRRAVAGGDDLAGIARRDAGHGEGPFELADRGPDGLLEGAAEVLLDEVDDDLGVGLGPERVALGPEPLLERPVVLDDAVVDEGDRAAAVGVRVGVVLARPAVGRPAGVPDAAGAGERMEADLLGQVADLALDPPPPDPVAVEDGDAGRVVAAVLEPPQSLDEVGHRVPGADAADDAAHVSSPLLEVRLFFVRLAGIGRRHRAGR